MNQQAHDYPSRHAPTSIVVLLLDPAAKRGEAISQALATETDITVHTCNEPEQMLALIGQVKPAVILQTHAALADAGLALLRTLRDHATAAHTPVVVLADQADPAAASAAFAAGASDYLAHQPQATELIARVRYHARAHHALQQQEQTSRLLHDTQNHLTLAKQQLEQITHSDGLTGLPNRRRFDDYLDMEWRRAMREQSTLSLLMVDVDYFKSYNDSFGHLQGDAALSRIGLALRESCARPADLAARFGGEVFVVVLPNTAEEGALLIAEKIRLSIMELAIEHENPATRAMLTVSIGVATRVPKAGPAITLLGLADEALYHAKTTGRNRVQVAVGP